ncbi:Uncharacterised protein [Yersinia enterocolitica]|nr:Uncharacterised protein [Yersinia enterocolitica]
MSALAWKLFEVVVCEGFAISISITQENLPTETHISVGIIRLLLLLIFYIGQEDRNYPQ